MLASRGYPESSESGSRFTASTRAEAMPDVAVYHAGTALRDGRLVTAGGRVLTVVGRGADFADAIARAYAGVAQISLRRDAVPARHRAEGARDRHEVFASITFGCRVNQADSLGFEEELRAARRRRSRRPMTPTW